MVKKGHGEGVDKPVHSMMKTIDYACFKLKAVKNKNNFINFIVRKDDNFILLEPFQSHELSSVTKIGNKIIN